MVNFINSSVASFQAQASNTGNGLNLVEDSMSTDEILGSAGGTDSGSMAMMFFLLFAIIVTYTYFYITPKAVNEENDLSQDGHRNNEQDPDIIK